MDVNVEYLDAQLNASTANNTKAVYVTLSESNLIALLLKLCNPRSTRVLSRDLADRTHLYVKAEPDKTHYQGRDYIQNMGRGAPDYDEFMQMVKTWARMKGLDK